MWTVLRKDAYDDVYIATTQNQYQADKVTNALNKMAFGTFFYRKEVSSNE